MFYNFLVLIISLILSDVANGYLESVAANILSHTNNDESSTVKLSEPFLPMVAFKCGYRNRYYSKQDGGKWLTDLDPNAGCLAGKLDILKYCRKVYPGQRITNIVESNQDYELSSWCKLDGHQCKWTFNVKPYRCIVGKFESEALLVPEHCHFGHLDDQKLCKDFDYWNQTSQKECKKRRHIVKSFSMLEPCGLDMFSGVEYVCCPNDVVDVKSDDNLEQPSIDLKVKVKVGNEQNKKESDVNDDESSEESDEADDDESGENETKMTNMSHPSVKKRVLTSTVPISKFSSTTPSTMVVKEIQTEGGIDDEDDDDSDEKAAPEDSYFRKTDPDHEYIMYRTAIDQLEKRHKEKVAAALKKLSESEIKYDQNKEHDPAKVENMKREFKHTMAKLEKEHHEERHRVEQVHEQRVAATLNERKRQTIQIYQQALSTSSGQVPKLEKVLHALQAYIKAEEKERTHLLNRYRYLLRADGDEATLMKESLIKKLYEIDLRINGTIEMTRDVHGLEEKLKPVIFRFWQTFRNENTPGRVDDSLTWIGDARNGEKLVEFYKKTFEYNFQKEKSNNQKQHKPDPPVSSSHKINIPAKPEKESDIRAPVALPSFVAAEKLSADRYVEHDEVKHAHAFSLKESLQHAAALSEEVLPSAADRHHSGYVVLAVAGVALLVATILGIALFRKRRSMHAQGFVAVDGMTPEERHVSGMQANGYENPTYRYFDANCKTA